MTLQDKHQIIINAFQNPRFGVSPTCTLGAVLNYSKKHGLVGEDYNAALASAIDAGLLAPMSGSALAIRNAGRAMLSKR